MPTALLADAHLAGPGGPAGPLAEQLAALPAQGCRHLVLMGDLFQSWVGFESFETADIRAVVAALRALRARGVEVEYVEGNRDFFLAGSPYADAFDRIALETSFEVGGVRYLAVHGDGLNDRDWKYRFWRWLSKSAPVRLAVRAIPARAGAAAGRLDRTAALADQLQAPRVPPRGGDPRLCRAPPRRGVRRPPARPLPRGRGSGRSPAARCACSTPGSAAGRSSGCG